MLKTALLQKTLMFKRKKKKKSSTSFSFGLVIFSVFVLVQNIYAVNIHEGNRDFIIVNDESTRNILGNIETIGNTVTCITTKTDASGVCIEGTNTNTDNERYVKYLNIENSSNINGEANISVNGISTTIYNATSAELNISTPTPNSDYEVVWAGLFWQGSLNNWNSSNRFFHQTLPSNINLASFNYFHQDEVFFHFPNMQESEYIKVKLSANDYYDYYNVYHYDYGGADRNGGVYSAFADITQLFKTYGNTQNPNGTYKLANLKTVEGHEGNLGNFGGWGLVVIYKNAHDLEEKFRNISVYSGYKVISAQHNTQTEIYVSGFLTPKEGDINSTLSILTGEAERYSGDYSRLVTPKTSADGEYLNDGLTSDTNLYQGRISGKTASLRNPNFYNTNGIDIRNFDVSSLMDNEQTSATIKIGTSGDTYFPSMVTFSTELFMPRFCYDYSYKQFNRFFTEDVNATQPSIKGDVIPGYPVDVSLYIRNNEASDVRAEDLKIDIYDINTSQATYIPNTTYLTKPGEIDKSSVADDINTSDSTIANIDVGTVDAKEYFYLYYSLDPSINELNLPIFARISYSLHITLPNGNEVTIDNYNSELSQMPPCVMTNVPYQPAYGIFNVVQRDVYTNAGSNYYNIPTQVAGRSDNFRVVSYDETDVTSEKAVSTVVGVEMIDVGAYHDINASCFEPTNTISPRKWIVIGGDSNATFADFNISDILPEARRNAAFRIVLNLDKNGSLVDVTEDGIHKPYVINNFTELVQDITYCKKIVPKPTGGGTTNLVSVACSNTGKQGITKAELDICMECIYGYNIKRICSRDNFSIRPESFFIKLSDIDQDLNTTFGAVVHNNSAAPSPVNLASGYRYRLDINATEFNSSTPSIKAAKGYTRFYRNDSADHNVSLVWSPPSASYNTACNETNTSRINTDFVVYDGTTQTPWNQNVFFSSTDIGIYKLNMIDKGWTLVDQNPSHHNTGPYASHFVGWDCTEGSHVVQDEGAPIGISGGQLQNINGCDINTSNYNGPNQSFNDLDLTFIPYRFNININRSVNTGYSSNFVNAWVYDSNVSNDVDKEEAFHITGSIQAAGYDGSISKNFVNGCYAKPISLYLDHNFTNMPIAFQYRLIDTNGSVLDDQFGDINSTVQFTFLNEGNFTKNQLGSTQIQLHLNFERSNNIVQLPRIVTFQDFNVTCSDLAACVKYADGDNNQTTRGSDQNTTPVIYYYGRVHAPDYRTDQNSIMTPIYAEVYCDNTLVDCSQFNITGWKESVNDINWWINQLHTSQDGNISELNATVSGALDSVITINNNGSVDNTVRTLPNGEYDANITYTGSGPHKTRIFVNPSNWLKYHRFFPDGRVFYNVTFESRSDWGGIGKLGKTVEANASKSTSHRIEW